MARCGNAAALPRLQRLVEAEGFEVSVRARAALVVAAMPDNAPPPSAHEPLSRVEDQGGRLGAPGWVSLVGCALAPEREPWLVQTMLEALWVRRRGLAMGEDLEEMKRSWEPPLGYWRERDEEPEVAEGAGKLLRWLKVQAKEEAAAALVVIDDWLDVAPEGQRRRFKDGLFTRIQGGELLDVLAVAAADGFDLAAEPLKRGYRVENGSLPRFALWRLLYELRRPANDKRKAFPHTTDCWPRGSLVALTDAQSEVTAPERVAIWPPRGGLGPSAHDHRAPSWTCGRVDFGATTLRRAGRPARAALEAPHGRGNRRVRCEVGADGLSCGAPQRDVAFGRQLAEH
ncbi:MAG: hypothetical protein JRH20_14865 [Deltaproteobacteria bacterium]|nr:hypothetical protein [Deltaproteobacteria bacterium]